MSRARTQRFDVAAGERLTAIAFHSTTGLRLRPMRSSTRQIGSRLLKDEFPVREGYGHRRPRADERWEASIAPVPKRSPAASRWPELSRVRATRARCDYRRRLGDGRERDRRRSDGEEGGFSVAELEIDDQGPKRGPP